MRKGKKPDKSKTPPKSKDSGGAAEFERQTQEKAELVPPARRPPTAVGAATPPRPPPPPRPPRSRPSPPAAPRHPATGESCCRVTASHQLPEIERPPLLDAAASVDDSHPTRTPPIQWRRLALSVRAPVSYRLRWQSDHLGQHPRERSSDLRR